MKKRLVILLLTAMLALAAAGLAACGHAHVFEHVEAVEATCETEGNIEYWFCADCRQYYSDKDGNNQIAALDVVVHVLGHDRIDVAAVAPTCTESGNTEGFTCSRCDYTTVQTLPAGHDMTHHAEIPVACFENGVKEYWTCSRDEGVYYADANGNATLDDITIYATGHDMTFNAEVAADCTHDGIKDHWACSREPGVYYADEDGSATVEDCVIPAIGHDMSRVDALSATCTDDGHVAYWACAHEQDVYYANEQGSRSIANVVIPAIGHDWEQGLTRDDAYHWHVCKNGCGVQGDKAAHDWGDGEVTKTPTTQTEGERHFTCDVCGKEKTEIIPALGTFDLVVVEKDTFNNKDGGSVSFVCDRPLEDGKYVEGSVITVTVTLNDGFGIGSICLNDNEIIGDPLAADGVYTFRFVMEGDTTLTVEFGKLLTTNRKWSLRDGSGINFAYPWEYYTADAAQNGNGTAKLYVYDATGLDAREHDFAADKVLYVRELYQTVSWATFNSEISGLLNDMMREQFDGEQTLEFTLAFAIRIFPSAAKRTSGYVGSNLILPRPVTVGGVEYDMTEDYSYSKSDLSAPSAPQFSINDQGTALEFLRVGEGGSGAVFTQYKAAYIEIEMKSEGVVRYAYMFNDNGTLNIYSDIDKSGKALSCSGVNNAWISTTAFDNWAKAEYPDVFIYVTMGWQFRTKVHVDENSRWMYDGEWSSVIKHVGFDIYVTPSFEQMNFNGNGTAIEFVRLGGKGLLFTQYHAAYVEIEVKKGGVVYTMYLFYNAQNNRVYLYADSNMEGEGLDCGAVNNSSVSTAAFNTWASAAFEADFDAVEWEYRTKVHVDEDNYDGYWGEGDWSDVIKYAA